MQAILTFMATCLARIAIDKILMWVAFKVVLVALFTIVTPIILNNFLYDTMQIIFDLASAQSAAATASGNMTFTGFAAWLIHKFRIAECFAVIMSALMLRITLNSIPFVRLGA